MHSGVLSSPSGVWRRRYKGAHAYVIFSRSGTAMCSRARRHASRNVPVASDRRVCGCTIFVSRPNSHYHRNLRIFFSFLPIHSSTRSIGRNLINFKFFLFLIFFFYSSVSSWSRVVRFLFVEEIYFKIYYSYPDKVSVENRRDSKVRYFFDFWSS